MCPKNSQCQHSQNLPPSFLSPVLPPVLRDVFSDVQEPPSVLTLTLLAGSDCDGALSAHCVSLHCPPPPAAADDADLDRPTMSTNSLAAAALLRGDCLALAAGDGALQGGFDSLPLVTGAICLVCDAARQGDARGRSDLLDDVVDVDDVVHAVVDVVLDEAVDVILLDDEGLVVAAAVGLSLVVVVVSGVVISHGAADA